MRPRMDGKRVVVVGAGQQPGGAIGNGHAISSLLAREGAEICAVDVVRSRAEETAAEITDEGGRAHVIVADVTNPADCARLIIEAHTTMDGIDVLVNVVGLNSGDGDALALGESAWQRLMDANLRSMWLTSRAVVPIMQAQRSGVIINISSIASRGSGGPLFAYSLSKAGVETLTRAFAAQFAPWGIRCNVVVLGRIDSPHAVEGHHWRADPDGPSREEVVALGARHVPLGFVGTAWDTAHAVLFLSSDEARYITGVELPVDGGALVVSGTYERPADAPDPL
jgi:NAD(P)-dependent dehydrogenase (short-subunit alcohol dehydrogenase family)